SPRARRGGRHDGRHHGGRCGPCSRWRHPGGRRCAALQPSESPLLPCVGHHRARPPSRAPSATAATRPWYLLPPRSNTTVSTPTALARSATSSPPLWALAVLSPSNARRSASRVDAEATVLPTVSSTICATMWREERVTTRRGRTAVPVIFLRRRR